ncbi:MAG TPA: hypothetical protein VIR59_00835 [Gaiellaceae bacterium]
MRERWFGATGRRVPEIALEGELDLDDALVLDDATDAAALHAAHEAGRPIVVRASSAEEIKSALSHPEVAAALVPADRSELLEVDLRELTYGP